LPSTREILCCRNYAFSTKAKGREETLYFEDAHHTGRLRQQHRLGPKLQIDENSRTHLFLSEKRYVRLKKWRRKNKKVTPLVYRYERKAKNGKRHIEFAREGQEVVWHASAGIVCTNRRNIGRRIILALENILGTHDKK
jgi:hypothetical protein